MNTAQLLTTPLAKIVNTNYNTSRVFEQYGLDFCCKGKRTLEDACKEKCIPVGNVVTDLEGILGAEKSSVNFDEMSLTELATYIVDVHHQYVRRTMPLIKNYLLKVTSQHGDRYPYMKQVQTIFTRLNNELEVHLQIEEQVVFPLITDLEKGIARRESLSSGIVMMEHEHDTAGDLLTEIRDATSNYEIPEQACTTFKVLLRLLHELETDMHKHVHLENHLLFPRAVKLAGQIGGAVNGQR